MQNVGEGKTYVKTTMILDVRCMVFDRANTSDGQCVLIQRLYLFFLVLYLVVLLN